jgi:hypothetical protein
MGAEIALGKNPEGNPAFFLKLRVQKSEVVYIPGRSATLQ